MLTGAAGAGMAGLLDRLTGSRAAAAQLPAADGTPRYRAGLTRADIDAVFARGRSELAAKTALHARTWHADTARWAIDLDAGTITFDAPRRIRVVAPVQVIGTLNTVDGTFLWGWDHPSVPTPLAEHARTVRAFGEAQRLDALTTRKIAATETRCWDFTALAVHLAGAAGGYRGPTGPVLVFVTFGPPTIAGA